MEWESNVGDISAVLWGFFFDPIESIIRTKSSGIALKPHPFLLSRLMTKSSAALTKEGNAPAEPREPEPGGTRRLRVVRGEDISFRLLDLRELWRFRELALLLSWRDLKLRYAQTFLGIGWAIIQPLFALGVFSLFFGKLVAVPSDEIPYPIFNYSALLPWTFFANALGRSSTSLVANANMVSKVYFPRLVLPLGAIIPSYFDFAIGFTVICGLMIYYGFVPSLFGIIAIPLLTLLMSVLVLGISLIFCSLNARYRDMGNLLPFLINMGLYMTPVIYPVSLIPEQYRSLMYLNPMVGIIEGFRSAFLNRPWDWFGLGCSAAMASLTLIVGLYIFRKTEGTLADYI